MVPNSSPADLALRMLVLHPSKEPVQCKTTRGTGMSET
jgi:hypothetical protein